MPRRAARGDGPRRPAGGHGHHAGVPRDHARARAPPPGPGRRRRLPRAVPHGRPPRRDRRVRRRHPRHRRPPEPARARPDRRRRRAASTSRPCCSGGRATRCSPRATCGTCASGCRTRTCTASRAPATSWSRTRTSPGRSCAGSTRRDVPEPSAVSDEPYRALGATLDERADDDGTALIELAGPRSRRVTLGGARGPDRSAGPRPRGERRAAGGPGRPPRAAGGGPHRRALRVPAARGGRRRRRRGPRCPGAHPGGARGRSDRRHRDRAGAGGRAVAALGADPGQRRSAARGGGPDAAASTRRWTTSPPSAAPPPTTSRGPTPTPTRRSCSPPGRPDRPRASSTRTAGSPRCATRSARTYGIGPDSPLVAAFAPFVLLGPALGATSASPDMDVTAPGTLTARALAEAVRAIDAAVVFASPAALRVGRPHRRRARSSPALAGVRLFLSAGAPVGVDLLEAAAALMPAAEAHTPYGMTEALVVADVSLDELRAVGTGDGVCVGRPVAGVAGRDQRARRRRRADRGSPGPQPGVTGEVLVSARARQGAVRRALAHPAGVGAGRRLAPDRRRRAPRRRRSAVDRGPARARAGDRRRRAHPRRAGAAGADGRLRACPRRWSGSGRAARSRSSWSSQPEVYSHGPVVAEPGLAAAVRAALAGTDVAAVLVVEQLPDGRPAQLEGRPDPRRRVGGARAGGRAGAPVTRVLVTGRERHARARRSRHGSSPTATTSAPCSAARRASPARRTWPGRSPTRRRRPPAVGDREAVVHLAAKVTITGTVEEFEAVNVGGTAAAARRGAGRRRRTVRARLVAVRRAPRAARWRVRAPGPPTPSTRAGTTRGPRPPPSCSRSRRDDPDGAARDRRPTARRVGTGRHPAGRPDRRPRAGGPAAGARRRRRAHRHDLRRQRRGRPGRGPARRRRGLRRAVRRHQRGAASGRRAPRGHLRRQRGADAPPARPRGARPWLPAVAAGRRLARRSRCRASRR